MTDTTIVTPFVSVLAKLAEAANEARDKYIAARAKPDTSFKSVIESNPDDPKVVAFKTAEEKIAAKIKALQEQTKQMRAALVSEVTGAQVVALTEAEEKALKTDFLDLQKKITKTRESVLALLDGDSEAFDSATAGINFPKNLGGGSGTRKSPEGDIVRLRISAGFYNGESLEDSNGKVSLTSLALKSKVDGAVIREALAKAAGVSDIREIPRGETVSFEVVENDVTHNFAITVAEKPGKKSAE